MLDSLVSLPNAETFITQRVSAINCPGTDCLPGLLTHCPRLAGKHGFANLTNAFFNGAIAGNSLAGLDINQDRPA